MKGKIKHILDKNVYEWLRRYFTVCDKPKPKSSDPLAKVHTFVNMVAANFRKHYVPEEFLVVDESTLRFETKVKQVKHETMSIYELALMDGVRTYTLDV